MKIVLVANIPSPYRVTLFNKLNSILGNDFNVFYCSTIEKNRKWNIPELHHSHIFLKERSMSLFNRIVYVNTDVWGHLKKSDPDIIVTGGFTPTMLLAIIYARLYKKKHFINTDSWALTERKLSFIHKWLRRLVYKNVDCFLPVSKKGAENIVNYGIAKDKIFICPYVINVNSNNNYEVIPKKYDVMFSGQFIERKMPHFFCDIVIELNKRIGNINVLLIGSGPLQEEVCKRLRKNEITYNYPGFIQQNELPFYYASSKLLLFPTKEDGWGVVANEACAVGTPVITCDNAGVADDLIINDYNGIILDLIVDTWVDCIMKLLGDKERYNTISKNALIHIQNYSSDSASKAFLNSINNPIAINK